MTLYMRITPFHRFFWLFICLSFCYFCKVNKWIRNCKRIRRKCYLQVQQVEDNAFTCAWMCALETTDVNPTQKIYTASPQCSGTWQLFVFVFSDVNLSFPNKKSLWTPLHAATFQEHGPVGFITYNGFFEN